MTPQHQLFRHRPAEGEWGDCYRACIASILDMPIEDVPHFMHGTPDNAPIPPEVQQRILDWFSSLGLTRITFGFPGDMGLDGVLRWVAETHPGLHYMLVGSTARGVNHIVICRDDRIVHDPVPPRADGTPPEPVIGPADTGLFHLEFIGKLV